MSEAQHSDFLIIGAGPAGQKAAVQAAKEGRRVIVVDRGVAPGGECVKRGTIPSKTLRASAAYLSALENRAGELDLPKLDATTKISSLMHRVDAVLSSHESFIGEQLLRNDIEYRRGKACFLSPEEVEITAVDGSVTKVTADTIVIATGSRPRRPAGIPIDHDRVVDSDSVLSMLHLPVSLAVMGAGVIASEFASIFQALGVRVTMIDRGSRPLGFLDPELSDLFVEDFTRAGGTFLANESVEGLDVDPFRGVNVHVSGGDSVRVDKVLVAQGRTASVSGLGLDRAGIELDGRGQIVVDGDCRTAKPHIYAVGDAIGPPALATTSMEQGRRAVRHALGLGSGNALEHIPIGIYTIPEMASVGATEKDARETLGDIRVGRADFAEIARGQINGTGKGMLKLVADARGETLLGAHVIGEGATEIVHLAQLAMLGGLPVDAFVENIFNFPTLAEAYRVAALEVIGQGLPSGATGRVRS